MYYEGPGVKERAALLRGCNQIWGQLMKGEEHDKELFRRFYQEMARDIRRERRRIGGDFAVAHVVLHRENRDRIRQGMYHYNNFIIPPVIRDILGPDLVFINLWMSAEERRRRILQRHKGDTAAANVMNVREIKSIDPSPENPVIYWVRSGVRVRGGAGGRAPHHQPRGDGGHEQGGGGGQGAGGRAAGRGQGHRVHQGGAGLLRLNRTLSLG